MAVPTVAYHRPNTLPDQRTVVVLGHFRGGTSMVAGILRMLGLFMGDRIEPGNNEDAEFKNSPPDVIRERIRTRNAAHDVWGYKYPGVFLNGAEWIDELRNPLFVCVSRDPLASAQSEVFCRVFDDEFEALRAKVDHQRQMLEFLELVMERRHPLLLISYERALRYEEEVVDAIDRFVGLEATPEARRTAIDFVTPERGHADPEYGPCVSLEFVLARRLREVERERAGSEPVAPPPA